MRSRDAILVGVLAACGGASTPPDATTGSADAAGDTGTADALDESTRVDVTAYTFDGDGAADPSAFVIFSDPNGVVLQHGPVDANGRASAYLPLGGSVTVLQPRNDPNNLFRRHVRLTTIRGVQPGDELIAGRTRYLVKREGEFDVMHASYTPINNAAGPYIRGACAEPGIGNPRPVVFYKSCSTPTFDLLTLADDQSTNVRNYVWQSAIPLVPDGTFTIPNTWQPMAQNTTTFHDVPANLQRVTGTLYAVIDGVPLQLDGGSVELPPEGTSTISLLHAPLPTPFVLVAQTVQGIRILERYALVTTGSAASLTVDWAMMALPRVTNVQQNTTGLTWQETSAGSPDARVLFWTSQWTDGNQVQRTAYWELVEPAQGAPASVLPPLPAEYAADDPTVNSGTLHGAGVRYVDYDNLAGYDAARPHGAELMSVEHRMLTTDHRARVSFASNN